MEKTNRSKTKWKNIPNDGTLNHFSKLNNISLRSLKLTKEEALILPNNRILKQLTEEHLFAPTAKDVIVALQDGGICARLYKDNKERRELILKSADIVLPVIFCLGDPATSITLAVLANWIYDRWIKTANSKPPTIKAEYTEINQGETIIRWRKIEGPADEVQHLLLEESQIIARQDTINRAKISTSEQENNSKKDNWANQCNESANTAITAARNMIQEAKKANNENKREDAETFLRASLVKIREALLWVPREAYYKYIHDIGRRIHNTFGCQLKFEDGNYMVTCPVLLSHSKGGFSIGGSGKGICSICGEDVLDCSHVKGTIYDTVKAWRHHKICNICGKEKCAHKEGEMYDEVRAFAIIVEMKLDHISFVPNPSDPLCVIQSYSLSKSELLEMLPEDEKHKFVYGETIINCYHCLICKGSYIRGAPPLLYNSPSPAERLDRRGGHRG